MNGPTEGFLSRHGRKIAAGVVAGSWLPMIFFLLEVTSLQLHWWSAPWGDRAHHTLLTTTFVLALVYTALFTGMAAFWLKRRSSEAVRQVNRRKGLVDALSAAPYAVIGLWSLTALWGDPSLPLFWLFVLAWLALQVGAFHVAFRNPRNRPTSPAADG